MSYFSKRALRWAAPVALVGALGLAACGNDDTEAVRVAAPSVAGFGSDQHLGNKAEELARASASFGSDQHFNNRAAELANQQRAYQAASDRLTAQAEQYQRSSSAVVGNQAAQMAQSERYVDQQVRAASSSGNLAAQMAQAESYVNKLQNQAESSRAVQMTEAPAYVRQQQDRAAGNSNGVGSYDFLPGSHHVPTH
jgi:cell division septum initiation protein DivIVA